MGVLPAVVNSLPDLIGSIRGVQSYQQVVAALQRGASGTIDGAWGSACALVAAALTRETAGPLLVVLPRINGVDDFAADLAALLETPPVVFPAWETLPREVTSKDAIFGTRLRVLEQIESTTPPRVIVAPFPALLQPVPPRSDRQAGKRMLRVGETLDSEELLRWLVERGFDRVPAIERPGEFCVHGGIVDIYPPAAVNPIRMELFGEEIDSLRYFDVETQRKVEDRREIQITAISPRPESSSPGGGPPA